MIDNEGYDEKVVWKFDDEGAEGFTETLATFKEFIPDDMITYLPRS